MFHKFMFQCTQEHTLATRITRIVEEKKANIISQKTEKECAWQRKNSELWLVTGNLLSFEKFEVKT